MTTIAWALLIAAAACWIAPDRIFARSSGAGIVLGILSLLAYFGSHHH